MKNYRAVYVYVVSPLSLDRVLVYGKTELTIEVEAPTELEAGMKISHILDTVVADTDFWKLEAHGEIQGS
jgi:hypothetical protein